jgi:hypothetical protein
MTESASQQFLRELDKKLWAAADKLRAALDAAVYKHAVLGLIFLKYVSDSFAARQKEIEAALRDPQNEYFLDPAGYPDKTAYEDARRRPKSPPSRPLCKPSGAVGCWVWLGHLGYSYVSPLSKVIIRNQRTLRDSAVLSGTARVKTKEFEPIGDASIPTKTRAANS